ncbi:hypothetical protein EH223_16500 [candidate division KSB1 bacterium]|nr:hypothetical protein [candidate division KSB1 bacterium]RQW01029.1 MAG: hypothetical protein EH223_16500 [candidate division KSB1 bacterium]
MKRMLFCIALVLLVSCSPTRIVKISFTEKFEGQTQLILASQTTNINFIEEVSKSVLGILKSDAKVKVTSNVTYDFYVDFMNDGYDATLDKKEKILYFSAPPIRVKKPVINASSVSFPETGILVNEPQEAVRILETLTDNFIDEGLALLQEPKVMAMCTEKLQDYMLGLCTEFGYTVERVDVTFRQDKEGEE